jgi:hypothetical protein
MAILVLAISLIDFAGRTSQRAVFIGVVLCSVALIWFALRRLASWYRVSTIAFAGVAAILAICGLASL